MRDIPNMKRLCQSILNVPLAEIDALLSEKRRGRRWKLIDTDFSKTESRIYSALGIDMMRQMIYRKEILFKALYGAKIDHVIFDEASYIHSPGLDKDYRPKEYIEGNRSLGTR